MGENTRINIISIDIDYQIFYIPEINDTDSFIIMS